MSDSISKRTSPLRAWLPWLVFALGPTLVITTFTIGYILLIDPQVRKEGSFLGFSASAPVLWIAFVCSTLSPLFTGLPVWRKCLFAAAGALIFCIVFFACFALLWVLRPPIV